MAKTEGSIGGTPGIARLSPRWPWATAPLRAYFTIVLLVASAAGFFFWSMHQNVAQAYLYRLQGLKTSAAALEKLLENSLTTVANLRATEDAVIENKAKSGKGKNLFIAEAKLNKVVERHPFLDFTAFTKSAASNDGSEGESEANPKQTQETSPPPAKRLPLTTEGSAETTKNSPWLGLSYTSRPTTISPELPILNRKSEVYAAEEFLVPGVGEIEAKIVPGDASKVALTNSWQILGVPLAALPKNYVVDVDHVRNQNDKYELHYPENERVSHDLQKIFQHKTQEALEDLGSTHDLSLLLPKSAMSLNGPCSDLPKESGLKVEMTLSADQERALSQASIFIGNDHFLTLENELSQKQVEEINRIDLKGSTLKAKTLTFGRIELAPKLTEAQRKEWKRKSAWTLQICKTQEPCFPGAKLNALRGALREEGWAIEEQILGLLEETKLLWKLSRTGGLSAELEELMQYECKIKNGKEVTVVPDQTVSIPMSLQGSKEQIDAIGHSLKSGTIRARAQDGKVIYSYSAKTVVKLESECDDDSESGSSGLKARWEKQWKKQPEEKDPELEWKIELSFDCRPKTQRQDEGYRFARLNLKLREMVHETVRERDFDHWVLLDGQDNVLTQLDLGDSPIRIGSMLKARGNRKDSSEDTTLSGLFPATGEFSKIVDVVAGAQLRILCQPLSLPVGMDEAKTVVESIPGQLCGAIEVDKVVDEAVGLAPSRTSAWILGGLFLLGLLGYAKPTLMDRQERLRRIDLVLLTTGTLLMLTVAAVSIRVVFHQLQIKDQIDDQLEHFRAALTSNLTSDLKTFSRQLQSLDDFRCGDEAYLGCLSAKEVSKDEVVFDVDLLNGGQEDCSLKKAINGPSPFFRSVFWLNDRGRQVHKATSGKNNTPVVSLAERAYFQEAKDGHGLKVSFLEPETEEPGSKVDQESNAGAGKKPDSEDKDTEPKIYVESFRSITTGEVLFAMSRRSSCYRKPELAGNSSKLAVSALTGALPVMHSVVNPPFGFAVTDSTGEIVFASVQDLHSGRNLLEEVDPQLMFEGALQGRKSVHLDAELGNRDHRFLITPFLSQEAWSGMPAWHLVVFADKEFQRTLIAESSLLSAALVIVYSLIFFLVIWSLRSQVRDLFWQRSEEFWAYVIGIVLLGLYGLAIKFIVWDQGYWTEIIRRENLFVLTALLLVAGMPFLLVFRAQWLARRLELGDQGWIAGRQKVVRVVSWSGVGLFWLVAGVIPGFLFFESAWQLESQAHRNGLALWQEQAKSDRDRRVKNELKSFDLKRDISEARMKVSSDRFYLPFARPTDIDYERFNPLGLISERLPTYNKTAARIRLNWASDHGLSYENNIGDEWSKDVFFPRVEWILLLFIGICCAVWIWSLSIRKALRLQLSGHPPPLDISSVGKPSANGPIHRIVVLTSPDQWDYVKSIECCESLDLTHDESETNPSRSEYPLFIHGLTQVLAEPQLHEAAIPRLEAALRSDAKRSIWIFTSNDPWLLLEEAVATGRGRRESASISDFGDAYRWLHLLSSFQRFFAPVDWSKLPEDEDLSGHYWPILWRCSTNERLALLHMAQESMINPKQAPVVRSLISRGILTTNGAPLSFLNDGFREFVSRHASLDHLVDLENKASRHGWGALRFTFALFFAALFCTLFFLDKELLNNVSGLLSGLVGVITLAAGLSARLSPGFTKGEP